MKLLTIVIPSYNTEKFIDKNMKTFIDKRLQDDVEILLVNDGSKDKTKEKVCYYASRYPDFVRAINKKNGGHGSTINMGIEKAKGKYFKVIDADDWVDTEALIRLTEVLKDCNADLVINPYIKIDQNSGKTSIWGQTDRMNKEQEYSSTFNEIQKTDYRLALHSITIKSDILKKNKIKLTENCFYEDFEYTFFLIPYIKTVLVLNYPVYYYLVGQKTQSVNASNGLKNMHMYIRVLKDSLLYYNKIVSIINDGTKEYMEHCLLNYIRSMYNIYLRNKCSKDTYARMLDSDRQLRSLSTELYNKVGEMNPYIRLIRKKGYLSYSLLSFLFKVYKAKDIS